MVAYSTELPIRPDLDQAHAEVASRWSTTGSWWSGVERLAIVEEVRHARDSEHTWTNIQTRVSAHAVVTHVNFK